MITYLLHTSICLGLFYLIYLLILKRVSFFRLNRFYLLFSLLLSLIIPVLAPLAKAFLVEDFYKVSLPEIFITSTGVNTVNHEMTTDIFQWIYLLHVIYFAGVITAIIAMLFALRNIYLIISRGNREVKSDHTLVTTDQNITTFSFLHFIVIPQQNVPIHPYILRHELIHIQQYHTLDMLMMGVMKIILWFNPVVYAMNKELKNLHEYEADAAFKEEEVRDDYVQILLDGLERRVSMLGLSNHFYNSLIKKRIDMMYKRQTARTHRWKYLLLLPATLFLISTVQSGDIAKTIITSDEGMTFLSDTVPPIPPSPPSPPKVKNPDNKPDQSQPIIAPPSPPAPPPLPKSDDEEVYKIVDEMPRFPGCENSAYSKTEKEKCSHTKMIEYIYLRLKYPEEAKINGIEGTVIVQFIIDKNGDIKDISVVRDIGGGCGAAAVATIHSMVNEGIKWTPGRKDGTPVNIQYTMPLKFKIDND